MTPSIYLTFHGTCAEALSRYAEVLGGTVTAMMHVSEAPGADRFPPDKQDWVMHAELILGEGRIMGADDIMGGTPPMRGASIMMSFPTVAKGKEVFEALAQGGEVRMEYQPTFFSPGFGTLTDRFGIQWMISTTEPLPGAVV